MEYKVIFLETVPVRRGRGTGEAIRFQVFCADEFYQEVRITVSGPMLRTMGKDSVDGLVVKEICDWVRGVIRHSIDQEEISADEDEPFVVPLFGEMAAHLAETDLEGPPVNPGEVAFTFDLADRPTSANAAAG